MYLQITIIVLLLLFFINFEYRNWCAESFTPCDGECGDDSTLPPKIVKNAYLRPYSSNGCVPNSNDYKEVEATDPANKSKFKIGSVPDHMVLTS